MTVPPSGAQYPITWEDQEAVVVEVGGGLRTMTVAGEPVVDGYGVDDVADAGRGQLLIPWPNRIRDGRYRFGGVDLQLAITEPARQNASHGLVRWANWTATSHQADRVVMGHAFVTGEGLRVLAPAESWTTTWGIAAGPGR